MVFNVCNHKDEDDASDDEEGTERASQADFVRLKQNCELSYIGSAAVDALHKHHSTWRALCWHVTHGRITDPATQTPQKKYWGQASIDPENNHDDWFPEVWYNTIIKARHWVDVTSLTPPDGKFLDAFARAMATLAVEAEELENPITIRLLFGNIIGMPSDPDKMMKTIMADVPEDANLQIWIGSWRKGVSWNHSKIVAVDGQYLINGGHNMWDDHYLKKDPVHDLTMQAEGAVADDGHVFANYMWQFIENTQNGLAGRIIAELPDWLPIPMPGRVAVSEWGTDETFPPAYERLDAVERIKYDIGHVLPGLTEDQLHKLVEQYEVASRTDEPGATNTHLFHQKLREAGYVPMISMGRYGELHRFRLTANPSDSAITAMLGSAKTIIQMSLQDLGPLTLPFKDPVTGGCVPIPGGVWPDDYLGALAIAIADRGVDVEIVLSNPASVPGGVNPMTASYGNGWTCSNVASEIIKRIKKLRPNDHSDEELRQIVKENLRLCYLKSQKQAGGQWPDGNNEGNHAKFFIIDKQAYYMGSQNLYIANLAEWGVVVDDEDATKKVMAQYWDPLWAQSFVVTDCDPDEVMDGLDIDRDGTPPRQATDEEKAAMIEASRRGAKVPHVDGAHDGEELAKHYGVHEDDVHNHFDGLTRH